MPLPDPASDTQLAGLITDLTSGDDAHAEAAALALAVHPQGLAAISPLLRSANEDQRWWAVRTLAGIPAERAGRALAQALTDPAPAVRHCAALGLSHRPHPAAIPALVAALKGKDSLLTRLAGNALAAAGPQAVPALLDVLGSAASPAAASPARPEAMRALAQIGDERSIPAMLAAFDEDSALMEYWANAGLERMGVGMTFFKP